VKSDVASVTKCETKVLRRATPLTHRIPMTIALLQVLVIIPLGLILKALLIGMIAATVTIVTIVMAGDAIVIVTGVTAIGATGVTEVIGAEIAIVTAEIVASAI
jgi:hypothetical protein